MQQQSRNSRSHLGTGSEKQFRSVDPMRATQNHSELSLPGLQQKYIDRSIDQQQAYNDPMIKKNSYRDLRND